MRNLKEDSDLDNILLSDAQEVKTWGSVFEEKEDDDRIPR